MRHTVRAAATLAIAGFAAASATCALAQVKPGADRGLGLTGADIPPLLKEIQADPYRAPAEPACESIPREILALDAILGPDVDNPVKTRTSATVANMAGGAVRGLIPYRGWVRFLTQAGEKDKKLQRAATAGYARRGFLRGLEANLQCAAPSPHRIAASAVVADNGRPAGERIAARMVAERPRPGDEAPADAIDGPDPARPRPSPAVLIGAPAQASPGEVSDPRR
jgi:hypothetical protein